MPATSVANEQVIEAVVSGPDGANRLYTVTGQAPTWTWLAPADSTMITWTFHIGPELGRRQFHRGIGSAWVGGQAVYTADPSASGWYSLSFQSVEADWDDEANRTEMRVEVRLETGPGVSLSLSQIGFSATVLAELPAT